MPYQQIKSIATPLYLALCMSKYYMFKEKYFEEVMYSQKYITLKLIINENISVE